MKQNISEPYNYTGQPFDISMLWTTKGLPTH